MAPPRQEEGVSAGHKAAVASSLSSTSSSLLMLLLLLLLAPATPAVKRHFCGQSSPLTRARERVGALNSREPLNSNELNWQAQVG